MAKACVRCKQKKVKCDSMEPSCSTCLKLGLRCESSSDRRIDKRTVQDGISSFVFKNSGSKNKRRQSYEKSNFVGSSGLIPTPISSSEGGPPVGLFDRSTQLDSNSFLSCLEFGDTGELLYELDIENFFLNVDGSSGLDQVDSHQTAPLGDTASAASLGTDSTEAFSHLLLIDTVFNDESHTPMSITRLMMMAIDAKSQKSEDESFLLNIVLAIGALTLGKRDLAQSSVGFSTNASNLNSSLVASEVVKYFQNARHFNSFILEKPSRNGFRGLVLMANFLTGLLTLEAQMIVSFHALQIAVSLGLHRIEETELLEENYELSIAFWELWCSACLFSSFHDRLPPIRIDEISTPSKLKMENAFDEDFFQLRIRLAEIHCQVRKNSVAVPKHDLRRALADVMETVDSLEEQISFDEQAFHRRELLLLELKCWKSQALMLDNRYELSRNRSKLAVNEARKIVRELWSHYNPETFKKGILLAHLDWNYTYPLRTATMCAFTAARILTEFINSVGFLSFDYFDYSMSRKLLDTLTNLMPINKPLLKNLDEMMNQ